MSSSWFRSRAQLLFFAALVLLLAAVSVQYARKVLTPRDDGLTQSAILRWAKQIQAMEDGENIHAKFNYPNPPIMPQMLWPIAKLVEVNELAGALTLFYLKVGMAVACWLWAFRLVESPDRPYPQWAKAIVISACLVPIVGDLKHGNINLFIVFLVMASLYSFSRGRDTLAGLLLALAIASKVTPALFVIYFLWKRCWGVLVGCAIGLILFFLVVPSLVFALQMGSLVDGWNQNWSSLMAWVDGMIVPYVVRGEVWSERENQSLPGLLSRLLTHEPSFSKWINDVDTPVAYHNFADLTPMAVKRIVQLGQLVFLLLVVLVCRAPVRAAGASPRDLRRGWRLAAEYSLILVGMLLFSERTWKHHCVTLILPFAVLGYAAFAAGFPSWKRRVAMTALFAAASLIQLPTAAEVAGKGSLTDAVGELRPDTVQILGVSPNSARELSQIYGAYTIAFLVFLVGTAALLIGRKGESASGAT